MAQQSLGVPELVVRALLHRDLNEIALRLWLGSRRLSLPWGKLAAPPDVRRPVLGLELQLIRTGHP
jgi:hypothetical protein